MRQVLSVIFCCFIARHAYSEEICVTATTGVFSQYIAVHGAQAYGDAVSQTDIAVGLPKGFSADVWASTGFDTHENSGKEIDYSVGWAGKHIDAKIAYFDLNKVFSNKSGDVVYPATRLFASVVRGNHKVSPYVQGAYVVATKDARKNSGALWSGGFTYTWAPNKRFDVSEETRILYDTGIFGGDHGYIARYGAALAIKIAHVTFTPTMWASKPISVNDRKAFIVGGINMVKKW